MTLYGWRFRPGLWPSLAGMVLLALLLRLGFWQLERAAYKQTLHDQYLSRVAAEPVVLTELAENRRNDARQLYWRRCTLFGAYDPDVVYLLDNQVMRGAAGYRVYARFVLADGAAVLVERGWVAAPPDRAQSPALATPAATVALSGIIRPPPATGLALAAGQAEILPGGLLRVPALDPAQISATRDLALLPYIVSLEPPAPDGLHRSLPAPGSGRERHLGYAFQWFALALALTVIYFVVNTKRRL